mmetsp:Transcript_50901/g.100051  ORF Transcript_50901/g.100051 Transcript_50901/m.100051 type:complete len:228 (+) Transcript_50901:459-1142(+)
MKEKTHTHDERTRNLQPYKGQEERRKRNGGAGGTERSKEDVRKRAGHASIDRSTGTRRGCGEGRERSKGKVKGKEENHEEERNEEEWKQKKYSHTHARWQLCQSAIQKALWGSAYSLRRLPAPLSPFHAVTREENGWSHDGWGTAEMEEGEKDRSIDRKKEEITACEHLHVHRQKKSKRRNFNVPKGPHAPPLQTPTGSFHPRSCSRSYKTNEREERNLCIDRYTNK